MERAAGYSTECQELITAKNLSKSVVLKGLGDPHVALQDAWLFLNSSISEGLPLAMGEAALTGVPVVCTDVGASFCVVTDESTGKRFSEVVAPNDSESLARAQINVLACIGQWSAYAEDAPGTLVPALEYPSPTPATVAAINARMYEKQPQRRKLGMMGRTNVLNNFSADRYLREHEQMLWIGKLLSPSYQRRNPQVLFQRPALRPVSLGASESLSFQNWDRMSRGTRRMLDSGDSGIATRPSSFSPRLSPATWDALSVASSTVLLPKSSTVGKDRLSILRPAFKKRSSSKSPYVYSRMEEELGLPVTPPRGSTTSTPPRGSTMGTPRANEIMESFEEV